MGLCDDLDMLRVLAGVGVLKKYQMTVGRGRDPVMEQFRSIWSRGEMETGAGEMYGSDGIAEKNFLIEVYNFIKTDLVLEGICSFSIFPQQDFRSE